MEDFKLTSSHNNNHNNNKLVENGDDDDDDGCSIVLQLAEDDPFYQMKKSLLHDKGFDIRVKVHFESSIFSISDTMERMLPVARIIQLDEMELYFDELEERLSLGVYSPRNEMEALNTILSLIDTSISCETPVRRHNLHDLRDAVVDKITAFGDKVKVVTKVEKDYSCNKEKCLVEWGESNGVKAKVEIACVEGAGRGALALEDLKVGDLALEIPISLIISEDILYESDMYKILEKMDGVSSETMLLLWSMKEKHNCKSKYKHYFDTLPEQFNTGLSFGVEAIMQMDGTFLLEEIVQAKEHLRIQYAELFPALSRHRPDVFPPEFFTWEQFLWACELWYSNSMKVKFLDGKLRTCLVPIAGFLNHSLCPHVTHYGKVDSTTHSLKFPLSRPCRKGEECFLSYGKLSSSHLITFYGFLPRTDNLYDVIPLDIDVPDTSEDNPLSNWSTHMVRGTWFSNDHSIFHYGLPSPLLDHLRRAHGAELPIENLVMFLCSSYCVDIMENLNDPETVNRENTSWDVKLVMEFKDKQRKIISSILASCSSGLNLLANELNKCA
ncbi:hypothetical protein ACFE04_019880 [Oxalis oulophora]